MLDERSLRVLAEMGIDVYEPRLANLAMQAPASAAAEPVCTASQASPPRSTGDFREVLVIGASEGARWSRDVLATLKWLGVASRLCVADDRQSLRQAAGLVVLGEAHARSLSEGLDSKEQGRLHWVIGAPARELMCSVEARRALWGELKRISRLLGTRPY